MLLIFILFRCETCRQDQNNCTGHFGHIELVGPVYNPLMFNTINKLLRSKCFNCHKLKIKDKLIIYYYLKLSLIKLGYLGDAKYLDSLLYSTVCPNNNILGTYLLKFRYYKRVF